MSRRMDAIITVLADQQAELTGLLDGLDAAGWHAPTRCEGWDVADVVLHLAQTNEMAVASADGTFDDYLTRAAALLVGPVEGVDDQAAAMVTAERGAPTGEVLARWTDGAATLVALLDGMDLHARVPWVAGPLSARTLATTRLSETWIHTGDVAGALGVTLEPTDRLWQIARLAWRTLPYAFGTAGLELSGPVAFHLVGPDGETWDFDPDEPAVTTITGAATELCDVAARRVDPAATGLIGDGPDADKVLALVRTYAR